MKASRSFTTVGITPGEVRGDFPELREDLFYHLTDKNASGLEGAADFLLITSFWFIPVLRHIINQIHTPEELSRCLYLTCSEGYLFAVYTGHKAEWLKKIKWLYKSFSYIGEPRKTSQAKLGVMKASSSLYVPCHNIYQCWLIPTVMGFLVGNGLQP